MCFRQLWIRHKCNPIQRFVEYKRSSVPYGLQKRNNFYLEWDSEALSEIGGNAWNKDSLQNNQTVVICMINIIELGKLHLIVQNKKVTTSNFQFPQTLGLSSIESRND